MKPTVLITGGSGLLALNWAMASRERFKVVLGLHQRKVSLRGVQTRTIDLETNQNAMRVFEAVEPDLVVHTAGMTNVDACQRNPELARHINVDLSANVAQACAYHRVALVHISTDQLFAGDTAWVEETEPVAPKNVYGSTKAEAELRVLDAHARAVVVRTNFYGWGPSYRRSFSDVILGGLRHGEKLTLFRDVYYTPILSEVLVQAVHDLVDKNASGIFHVVGDERISKYEFGLKLAESFGLNGGVIDAGKLADLQTAAPRPNEMSLSNERTCRLLGRRLGRVDEHLQRLSHQERLGLAREVQNI